MLNRLASAAIVIFWFVMTFLLIRNEVSPEGSGVREVPLAHVMKLVYLHEQPSDLNIFNGPNQVGYFRLQPRTDRETGFRCLDLSGDLKVEYGINQKSRFNALGLLEMTPAFELRRSKWTVAMIEPESIRMEIEKPPGAHAAHYRVRSGTMNIGEGDVPEGESGLASVAKQLGLGASLDTLISQSSRQAPPVIRARQSSLTFRGERTETYLITIEQNGQMLLEAHISQLGQVLMAKTIIGYSFRLDSLGP